MIADVPNLSDDLRVKEMMQYDPELERQVWDWIEAVLEKEIGERDQPLINHLKSGIFLCELMNAISPNAIRKIGRSKVSFVYIVGYNISLSGVTIRKILECFSVLFNLFNSNLCLQR